MSPEDLHDWLNSEAFLALEGMRPMIADKLIALLTSAAPIDPMVRMRLADALDRGKESSGIRLEVKGTGIGNAENYGHQMQTRRRWIAAGRHMEALQAQGMTLDNAKREVAHLQDRDGCVFGFGASQAANIWKYFQGFRKFQGGYTQFSVSHAKITNKSAEPILETIYHHEHIGHLFPELVERGPYPDRDPQ